MEFSAGKAYVFVTYRLIPARRELWDGSERLELPPRVFDTLLALVAHRGEVVEKDELMRIVWPDTIVEENNLNQTIHLLRKVLRDGENGARFIETVPRRGYRFLASVNLTEDDPGQTTTPIPFPVAEAAPQASVPELRKKSAQWRLRGFRANRFLIQDLLLALALVLVASGVYIARRYGPSLFGGSDPIRSIAVLPLANLSNDPDQEYFADGMTDELITDLAQVSELRVVSKTSIMQYKGTSKPLPEIGRELGVDAVVEGSVLRSGGRVRITAQLIRAATDRHLWADAYEGDLRDVLQLQSQVAEAITGEVKLILTAQERTRFHTPAHLDPEAYDLYLRGRYFANQRNERSFHTAIDYYNQAVVKDPAFALGYAGLADCYTLLAVWGEGARWLADAEVNADKAIALDDTLAEAHTSLAAVKVLEWDWTDAEKEFQRSLALNPNDAQTHQWYGNLYLGPKGRHQEAIAELKRARDLDPLSPIINSDLGYAYFLSGQYDEAYRQYREVLARDPSFLLARYYLSQYYHVRGMYNEEVQELSEDFALSGHTKEAAELKALAREQNRNKLFEAMAHSNGTLGDNANSAAAGSTVWYIALNDPKHALDSLEQSFQAHEPGMIFVAVDPEFASLHSDPRFQDLVRRMGLQ
jgi:TolB-like protein/DNA-binding winged helix-turn-helix (wHTH) protein/Flp pilus assembly protein TadD